MKTKRLLPGELCNRKAMNPIVVPLFIKSMLVSMVKNEAFC
ncbi:hypothetical protein [Porphyromonas gingivalis]|nr:hypothetical protein [Porphyromonas gingivalis]